MLVKEKRKDDSIRVKTIVEGDSMTEQSHRDAVNINTIVARARKGILPAVTGNIPNYGDFSSGLNFHEAQDRIADAKSDFMMLPVEIRKRFENDPAKMIDFVLNEDNKEEAIELGLLPQPAPPEEPQPEAETKSPDASSEPV